MLAFPPKMAESQQSRDDVSAASQAFHDKIQSRSERMQLRADYRKLLNKLQQDKQELVSPTSEKLSDTLDKGNQLFSKVKLLREAVLDAEFTSSVGRFGVEQVSLLHSSFQAKDPSEFVEKLKEWKAVSISDPDESTVIDWKKLGRKLLLENIFHEVPVLDFLCGCLQFEPKVRKQAQRRKKAPTAPQVEPEAEDEEKLGEDNETSMRVRAVHRALKNANKPVEFWDLVLHPTHMNQTIENIFYYSFLIKDGHSKMYTQGDKLFCATAQPPRDTDASTERKQAVIKVDHRIWKEMVQRCNISTPFLGTRSHYAEKRSATSKKRSSADANLRERADIRRARTTTENGFSKGKEAME